MAAHALAVPRLSLNVRYNRNVKENSGEEEENQLKILEDEEHYDELGPQRASPCSPAAGNRRFFRATAVALGGVYLLVLAGLFIRYTSLQTRYEMLQTRYDQLSSNYSQIQNVSGKKDISIENSQLRSRYEILSVNHSELQDEVKQLETRIKEKLCPDGWKRSGCSCYFKSEKRNYWYGSRDDCEQSEAHLVVINNEEEQKFVTELSKDGEYWIGLRYGRRQGEYKWEWVDGSPLTETFWAAGLPHNDDNFTAVTCCDQQGKWKQKRNDASYHGPKKWICEKEIL